MVDTATSAVPSGTDVSNLSGVLMNGWFSEINQQWPGMANSVEIESELLNIKSQYQHIIVYKTKHWGNMLVLDGVIQLTERDEMSYQEMMCHIPLYAHHNPEHVLVIGGGDGGIIRELCKHSTVKSITICEIDHEVINAGKKYFPTVASAWNDSRVTLHVGDGAEFMSRNTNHNKFDCIITDSSDPIGPAQVLFESPFYAAMYTALKPNGIVCTQAESIWNNLDLIEKLFNDNIPVYQSVQYATTQIPTYPAGQIGFLLCQKAGDKTQSTGCKLPARQVSTNELSQYRYYTSELHAASFVHPKFVQDVIDRAQQKYETDKNKKQKTTTA